MTRKRRRLTRALLMIALLSSGTAVLAGTARADLVGDISSTTDPVPLPDPSPLPVLSPIALPVLSDPSPSPTPAPTAGATASPSPSVSTSASPGPTASASPDASSSPSPSPTATVPTSGLTSDTQQQDRTASTGTGGSTSSAPTPSAGGSQVGLPSSEPNLDADDPAAGDPAPLRPAGGVRTSDVPAPRSGGSASSRVGGVAVPTGFGLPAVGGWLQGLLTPSDLLSAPSLLTLPDLPALPGLQPTTGTWLPSLTVPGAPPMIAADGSPVLPGSTRIPLVSAGRQAPTSSGHPVGVALFALGAVVAAAGVAQFRSRGLR